MATSVPFPFDWALAKMNPEARERYIKFALRMRRESARPESGRQLWRRLRRGILSRTEFQLLMLEKMARRCLEVK